MIKILVILAIITNLFTMATIGFGMFVSEYPRTVELSRFNDFSDLFNRFAWIAVFVFYLIINKKKKNHE